MLLLDVGALTAVDRLDRSVLALLKQEKADGRAPLTHGGIVLQAWRGLRRPNLSRFLRGLEVVPLDDRLARIAGALLASSGSENLMQAALVALATGGDSILTADPDSSFKLSRATGLRLEIIRV